MDISKLVRDQVREAFRNAEQRDDVNIVSAVNVAESGTDTTASTRQDVDIVQNGRRTRVTRKTP
ncbi:MAG TPA: hypothetical protein VGO92_05035 [Acidimicrobiales bacterium]|jgi:hypothetical protein|nr:hypothetical protein [Acidimicrobiales bacterium]